MNFRFALYELLSKLGLISTSAVMYVCGSETLPPPLSTEEEERAEKEKSIKLVENKKG